MKNVTCFVSLKFLIFVHTRLWLINVGQLITRRKDLSKVNIYEVTIKFPSLIQAKQDQKPAQSFVAIAPDKMRCVSLNSLSPVQACQLSFLILKWCEMDLCLSGISRRCWNLRIAASWNSSIEMLCKRHLCAIYLDTGLISHLRVHIFTSHHSTFFRRTEMCVWERVLLLPSLLHIIFKSAVSSLIKFLLLIRI